MLQQDIFKNAYNSENWKQTLRTTFGDSRFVAYQTVANLDYDHIRIKRAGIIGEVLLDDEYEVEQKLLVFEFLLQPNMTKLDINRVMLSNIVDKIRDDAGVTGALAVFIDEQRQKWRLTLVAKQETYGEETIATLPKRYTYLLGEGENTRTVTERFNALQNAMFKDLKTLLDAFAVEKLSNAFFDEYTKHYKAFCEAVAKHEAADTVFQGNDKYQRDFVKRLLGRIVFLYFLQKKGWLGAKKGTNTGNYTFVKSLFEQCSDKNRFYSEVLSKLFFDTLNNENRKESAYTMPNGELVQVPFLNGGLFEEDTPNSHLLDFDASLFKALFDTFDQYNFTIDESSPLDHEVGIDPEMLGHIFENQLEDNKDKGAFYTPKQIVHYMCQESLIQYLQTNLNDTAINEVISHFVRFKTQESVSNIASYKDKIDKLLRKVKICDPAIGSGAFPMGLLHEVFYCLVALAPNPDAYELKKHIIRNSIYGVDIEKGAVDIARLRFWLSLVVDATKPEPLPNLDYKIMQGNSLLESYEGIPLDNVTGDVKITIHDANKPTQIDIFTNKVAEPQADYRMADDEASTLNEYLTDYFSAKNKATKDHLHQEIDNMVHEHIDRCLEMNVNKLTIQIADLEKKLQDKTKGISEAQAGLFLNKSKEAKRIVELKKALEKQQESRLRLEMFEEKGEKPYFLWHLYFKDVFDDGGFDIVIGNPPYVGISRMKDKESIANANFDTFESSGDLYALFYEQGAKLLKSDGVLSYITSRQWMQAAYGKSLRKFFTEKTNPTVLIDFGQKKLFKGATVFVNILTLRNQEYTQQLKAVLVPNEYDMNGNDLSTYIDNNLIDIKIDENTWKINDTNKLNEIIEAKGKALKDWESIDFFRGITTGYNDAFHITKAQRDELISQDPNNAAIIKPLLRGKDIKRYGYEFQEWYIINTHNGIREFQIPAINVVKDYPIVYKYLQKFENELVVRQDKGEHWTNLRNCAFLYEFDKPKIIWIEISDRANYAYDESGMYLTNSAYFLTCESENVNLKYVLAVLNSKVSDFYFSQHTAKIAGGRMRYTGQYVGLVRIPEIPLPEQKPFEILVDYILFLKSLVHEDARDRSIQYYFEHILDAAVSELFFAEEMHKVGFYVLESVKKLSDFDKNPTFSDLKALYEELNQSSHPLRKAVSSMKFYEPFNLIEEALKGK